MSSTSKINKKHKISHQICNKYNKTSQTCKKISNSSTELPETINFSRRFQPKISKSIGIVADLEPIIIRQLNEQKKEEILGFCYQKFETSPYAVFFYEPFVEARVDGRPPVSHRRLFQFDIWGFYISGPNL